MPGLLETPPGYFATTKFLSALVAECLGTMAFALVGGASQYVAGNLANLPGPNLLIAAWGNGLGLMMAVFVAANVSGGHINPAVTIATIITGNIQILNGILYIVVQLIGAMFASLILAGLIPHSSVGMGNSGPGCFGPGAFLSVNNAQIFGWELFGTFILVSVIYAVAIGPNSFGNVAPLAVGLTLTGTILMTGAFTGGAINPARAFGPSAVFHCWWDKIGYFVLGEVVGGIAAGLLACPMYGGTATWLTTFMPWLRMKELERHNHHHPDGDANVAPMEMESKV